MSNPLYAQQSQNEKGIFVEYERSLLKDDWIAEVFVMTYVATNRQFELWFTERMKEIYKKDSNCLCVECMGRLNSAEDFTKWQGSHMHLSCFKSLAENDINENYHGDQNRYEMYSGVYGMTRLKKDYMEKIIKSLKL